ncbi:TIGR04388 family protein [Leptospira congkakensis]|uniref:TIGR04388 family protein n=1 Tax=Leptospira congkakensis TaxID=2484932 RepID=A0A4Z1A8Y2_9LEPT|nr:TIGR04388 family protein [Leptospira congkakensis]TGL87871.1 TIGR04388 family protein [Leptospira congkakensis]TGL92648.1 TIGR04388 family protein [Leptospira congkakensis]TGL96021.1 TIGR04388 family protein [Leptospira congkakensis]
MILKSSFAFRSILVIGSLFLFICSVYGQSLSETWNVPSYQSSDYSEFYGNVYFSNSMEEWDYRVEEVLSFSMSQWLKNADQMIQQILSEEHGEDAFISNEGYLDERTRSLYSEVSVLYSEWERKLSEDFFDNRNAFLHKLETGKVDSLYLQRLGQESLFAEYTEEERTLAENRNRILESASEWEFEWYQTRQEGLDSFANAFSGLQDDYDDYIRSLQETDFQFSENLNAINSYKETIKTALRSVVSQLRTGLESSCEISSGCQYKNADGSYNEAGKIFYKFTNELSEELDNSEIDPDSLLTSISTKIREFLTDESNKAFSEHEVFQNQIYTYQTGFQINLDQTKSSFDLGSAEWKIRNQTYHDLTSDLKYENWLSGGAGEVGTFSRIEDLEMRGIFQSIHHGDSERLISIINSKLGGGKRVQTLISANLYTDAFHFINNDQFAGFYIPFDTAHHTNGNLMLDGKSKYGQWIADRYITILTPDKHYFQMGAIGYSVLYEMFDENSSKSSLYWKENSAQLGGQSNHFQNTLLPAVMQWESKVKEYAGTYDEWKENRESLVREATAKLEANRQALEHSKEDWLQRIEEEKKEGLKSWVNLYELGEKAETPVPSFSSPSQKIEELDRTKLATYQSLVSNPEISNGIQIGGVGLLEEFQRTITGVNQYASVIQMNSELEEFQRSEQKKLINQMTYAINSEALGGRSLTKEESILVGTYDSSLLSQEELRRFGSCYENPNANICNTLLKKEFEVSFDSDNGVLTLRKEIFDGLLASKNEKGEYTAGKTEEVRYIQLSSLDKVQTPVGKSFFTIWKDEDWDSLYESKTKIVENYYKDSLQKDAKSISSNINSIYNTDYRNQKLFIERKNTKENADSLFQELALAYFTGGAAGVRASLKGKVESAINSELAKAWITATGGNPEDIQKVSMFFDFLRGRKEINDKKQKNTVVSLKNPLDILNPIEQLKLSSQAGKAYLEHAKATLTSSFDFINNASGGIFGTVVNTLFMLPAVTIGNVLIGKDKMDAILAKKNAQVDRIKEIKANEVSMAKSAVSQALAKATGLPLELVSAGVGDFVSSRDAKKAREAIEKNPFANSSTNAYGVAGGIVKSALMAVGYKESELQHMLLQANRLGSSTSFNQSSVSLASLGLMEKSFTMNATGTSFQSQLLNIKDKDRVVEELAKRALAEQMAATWGIDVSIAKGFIDKGYGDYRTRENNEKAKSKAIEQTAITTVSVLVTMGASSALKAADAAAKTAVATTNTVVTTTSATATTGSSFLTTIGNAVKYVGQGANNLLGIASSSAMNTGQALVNATLQGIAGSKNGVDGTLAGVANGLLGGTMRSDLLKKFKDVYLGGVTPGLGVTYSSDSGWGGMVGFGNTTSNASVSFSRKGDTTVQGSYSLGNSGFQLAGDVTTNGSSNFGFNYNPTGEGARRDWNFSLMYDIAGTGLSASVGYTDPKSTLGLTSTLSGDGLSTSAELTGVRIATNGPNGFQLDDMNFAEQNINAAQDKTQDDQKSNQSSDQNLPEREEDFARDLNDAGGALLNLLAGGAAILVGLFGGLPSTSSGEQTTPETSAALERERRREEEDGMENDLKTIDPPLPPNLVPVIPVPGTNNGDLLKSPLPLILSAVDHFPPIDNKQINSNEVNSRVNDLKVSVANYNREIETQINAIKESDPKLKDPQNKELVKKLQVEKKNAEKIARVQEAQIRSLESKTPLISGTRPMNLESGITNIVTFEQNKNQKEIHDQIREFVKGGQLSEDVKKRLDQEKQSLPEYKKLKELQGQKDLLEADFQMNNLDRVNEIQFGGINQPNDLQNLLTTNPQKYNEYVKSVNEIQKQIDQLTLPIKKIDAEFEVRAKVEKYKEMGIGIEFSKNDSDLNYKLEQLNRAFGVENSRQDQIAALDNLKGKNVSFSKPLFDTIVTPTEGVAIKPAPGQGNLSIYQTADGKEIRRPIPMSESDVVTSRPDDKRVNPVYGKIGPHTGTDYSLPVGTENASVMEGTVEKVENSPNSFLNSADGGTHNGGSVRIESSNDNPKIRTTYYHLSQVNVQPGDKVKMGDLIGRSGNSGNSGGPHLHFIVEVKVGEDWILQKNEEFDWSGVP